MKGGANGVMVHGGDGATGEMKGDTEGGATGDMEGGVTGDMEVKQEIQREVQQEIWKMVQQEIQVAWVQQEPEQRKVAQKD